MKKTLFYFIALTMAVLFSSAPMTWAASLNFSSDKITLNIGDSFMVDIRVDSEGTGVNAFQASLSFPKDMLEVQSLDKAGSIVNFWLQEPVFSNEEGKVSFIGGSTSGFSGQSLQILRVNFRVKGAGQADLVFTDGAITASDGSGTNVLSKMNGLRLNIVPAKTIVLPAQITREAVPAAGLPAKPVLDIPLYPDPNRWYNVDTGFLVRWALPADTTAVAVVIDKNPKTEPSKSGGLFDNQTFPALPDGISYLHVRFKNNIGWGSTAHQRLAIDIQPPVPFEIKADPAAETSDPNPIIYFESADPLSGLKEYRIQLDNGEPSFTDKTDFAFSKLAPGQHTVRVTAADQAGNETSSSLELNTLALPSPVIVSVGADLFIGEGGLAVSGTALPNAGIDLTLKSRPDETIFSERIKVESNGNWTFRSDFPLRKGSYFFEAVARDERGALSYPVKSSIITVRERPLLVLAGIQVTAAWFFFGLVVILLFGFGAGVLSARLARKQRERKIIISQRDIIFSFRAIAKNIDKILEDYSDNEITPREAEEIKFILRKVKADLDKQKYIVKEVEEINR